MTMVPAVPAAATARTGISSTIPSTSVPVASALPRRECSVRHRRGLNVNRKPPPLHGDLRDPFELFLGWGSPVEQALGLR